MLTKLARRCGALWCRGVTQHSETLGGSWRQLEAVEAVSMRVLVLPRPREGIPVESLQQHVAEEIQAVWIIANPEKLAQV